MSRLALGSSQTCCWRRIVENNEHLQCFSYDDSDHQFDIEKFVTKDSSSWLDSKNHQAGWTKHELVNGFGRIGKAHDESHRRKGLARLISEGSNKEAFRRKTIQFPVCFAPEEEIPKPQLKGNKDAANRSSNDNADLMFVFRRLVSSIRRLIWTISFLVCLFEVILIVEYLIEWLGYRKSIQLVSCLSGRICKVPDLLWKKLGIGTWEWNGSKIWNALLRVGVTAHVFFFWLLWMSQRSNRSGEIKEKKVGIKKMHTRDYTSAITTKDPPPVDQSLIERDDVNQNNNVNNSCSNINNKEAGKKQLREPRYWNSLSFKQELSRINVQRWINENGENNISIRPQYSMSVNRLGGYSRVPNRHHRHDLFSKSSSTSLSSTQPQRSLGRTM